MQLKETLVTKIQINLICLKNCQWHQGKLQPSRPKQIEIMVLMLVQCSRREAKNCNVNWSGFWYYVAISENGNKMVTKDWKKFFHATKSLMKPTVLKKKSQQFWLIRHQTEKTVAFADHTQETLISSKEIVTYLSHPSSGVDDNTYCSFVRSQKFGYGRNPHFRTTKLSFSK